MLLQLPQLLVRELAEVLERDAESADAAGDDERGQPLAPGDAFLGAPRRRLLLCGYRLAGGEENGQREWCQ